MLLPNSHFYELVYDEKLDDQKKARLSKKERLKALEKIDPLGQPTVTAGSDYYFRTCCPSPLFRSSKTKQQKTMVATGETVGLSEWIIVDTCLVYIYNSAEFTARSNI